MFHIGFLAQFCSAEFQNPPKNSHVPLSVLSVPRVKITAEAAPKILISGQDSNMCNIPQAADRYVKFDRIAR